LLRKIGPEQVQVQTQHQVAAVHAHGKVVIHPAYPGVLDLTMDALIVISRHVSSISPAMSL
jgi:hypothetical protein